MKRCPRCGETKALESFGRNRKQHDGLQPYCKSCQSAYQRENAAKLRSRKAEYARKYYSEKFRARRTESYYSDLEGSRASARSSYHSHRAERAESMRKWRKANQVRMASHYAKRRALEKEAFKQFVDKQEVYERDGAQCGVCTRHLTLEEATLDHIWPLSKGGIHAYTNVQVAHASCNTRKGNKVPFDIDVRVEDWSVA